MSFRSLSLSEEGGISTDSCFNKSAFVGTNACIVTGSFCKTNNNVWTDSSADSATQPKSHKATNSEPNHRPSFSTNHQSTNRKTITDTNIISECTHYAFATCGDADLTAKYGTDTPNFTIPT